MKMKTRRGKSPTLGLARLRNARVSNRKRVQRGRLLAVRESAKRRRKRRRKRRAKRRNELKVLQERKIFGITKRKVPMHKMTTSRPRLQKREGSLDREGRGEQEHIGIDSLWLSKSAWAVCCSDSESGIAKDPGNYTVDHRLAVFKLANLFPSPTQDQDLRLERMGSWILFAVPTPRRWSPTDDEVAMYKKVLDAQAGDECLRITSPVAEGPLAAAVRRAGQTHYDCIHDRIAALVIRWDEIMLQTAANGGPSLEDRQQRTPS